MIGVLQYRLSSTSSTAVVVAAARRARVFDSDEMASRLHYGDYSFDCSPLGGGSVRPSALIIAEEHDDDDEGAGLMTSQESRRHHFVPELLLKPWARDGVLNGFWWDHREGRLSCRRKGAKAFCYDIDLLSVKRHEDGRDVLEREFFGPIDIKGRGRPQSTPR